MKFIKSISVIFIKSCLLFCAFSFLISLFNYFGILPSNIMDILLIISLLFSCFVGGFSAGMKSSKCGWLEGIKISIFYIVLIIIFNAIYKDYSIYDLFFVLLVVFSSIFGGITGINKKE